MGLAGMARPIRACRRLLSRSPARAGTDRSSLACETSRRKDFHHEDRIGEAGLLRDLYPRLDRPRSRPRLQLPRRPIRGVAILYPEPGARRVDAAARQI